MPKPPSTEPDNTAVRTALWRALHEERDGPAPVLDDDVGLRLVAPPPGWQQRGDMGPSTSKPQTSETATGSPGSRPAASTPPSRPSSRRSASACT